MLHEKIAVAPYTVRVPILCPFGGVPRSPQEMTEMGGKTQMGIDSHCLENSSVWLHSFCLGQMSKILKVFKVRKLFTLTLANWARIWIVPCAVGLAANYPLTPVIISWVASEHHDSIILVLSPID